MLSLPTELLAEVFSRVDEITKRLSLPLVCRRFHAIASSLPPSKWRTTTLDQSTLPFELHPGWSLLRVRFVRDDMRVLHRVFGILSPVTKKFIPLDSTSFAQDNATYPPCRRLFCRTAKRGALHPRYVQNLLIRGDFAVVTLGLIAERLQHAPRSRFYTENLAEAEQGVRMFEDGIEVRRLKFEEDADDVGRDCSVNAMVHAG